MEYVNSGFSVILFSSLWFLAWIISCYGIGSAIVRFSFKEADFYHAPLFYIFSVAIGLFLLSIYVFLIGILGFLQFYSLLPFLIAGSLLGVAFMTKGALCRLSKDDIKPPLIVALPIFILLVISFIAALAPETGNDALNYHLYFPKLYVEQAKIFFEPTHPRSLWPFMMEMLFTAGFLCQGVALAKLFHGLTAVLAIFAVPSAALYFWKNKEVAWVSLIFIATIPAIWMQSFYAYVDNAMMLYTFLSFIALWIWKERGMLLRGALIPAIFLSALISIKFYSLVPFALLVILFIVRALSFTVLSHSVRAKGTGPVARRASSPLFEGGSPPPRTTRAFQQRLAALPSWRHPRTLRFIRGMTILGLLCSLFSGFWFIRSWYHWGNPVFPFLPDLFGTGFHARAVGFSEMPKTFLNFLLLPWNLSMKVKTFGGEPLGILFLASLPLLLFSYKRIRGILFWIAVFCFFYLSIWFLLIQHTRFLFPLFPFLSLLFGFLLVEFVIPAKAGIQSMWNPSSLTKKGFCFLLSIIVLTQFLISIYYPAKNFSAGMGWISADRYLTSTERSYAFLKEIKPLLQPDDKILFMSEPRLFYSPVEAIFYGPAIELILKKEKISFTEWLKKNNIEYLLLKDKDPQRLDPRMHLRFGHVLESPYSQVLMRKIEVEGEPYYYALWKLKKWTNPSALRAIALRASG